MATDFNPWAATSQRKDPTCDNVNWVNSEDSGDSGICQYEEVKSMFENNFAPAKACSDCLIVGSWYWEGFVMAFKPLKSCMNLQAVPSLIPVDGLFLATTNNGELKQSLFQGAITLFSSHSNTCFFSPLHTSVLNGNWGT